MMHSVINSEINDEYHGSDHVPLSLTIDLNKIKGFDKVIANNIEKIKP